MFLSAIVKAHSDGHAVNATLDDVSVDLDDADDETVTPRTSDSANADALAALEKRLIELPVTHRARWL